MSQKSSVLNQSLFVLLMLTADMGAQDWFDFLCKQSAPYRPLSGGRGTFAIPSEKFEEICALKQAAE